MKTITAKVHMIPAAKQEHQVRSCELFINDTRQHSWGKLEALVCERITTNGHAWAGSGIQTYINHLYLTVSDNIKLWDWYIIDSNGLKISQCTSEEELISLEGREDCRKIVATTDTLRVPHIDGNLTDLIHLPGIPQSFMLQYVKLDGSINTVLLECKKRLKFKDEDDYTYGNKYEIKTDPNNYVLIHNVEKMLYSREDLISKMKNFKRDTELFSDTPFRKKYGSTLTYEQMEAKWFEENL